MRLALAALLTALPACGGSLPSPDPLGSLEQPMVGTVGLDPNPLTFWWYAGDGQELRPTIECALNRIRNATCLPVDVSLDAHHWIRQKPAADMAGSLGRTTGASWSSTRISLQSAMGPQTNCRVLVHEIAQHTLRRRNDDGHIEPRFHLSAELVASICSTHDCPCQFPEVEDNPLPVDSYDWECAGIGQ